MRRKDSRMFPTGVPIMRTAAQGRKANEPCPVNKEVKTGRPVLVKCRKPEQMRIAGTGDSVFSVKKGGLQSTPIRNCTFIYWGKKASVRRRKWQ